MLAVLILLLLLEAREAWAGDSTFTDDFVLNAPFERVSRWIESNGDKIRESANVKLVEQHGDLLTLRRQNNRGTWQWKQRESIVKVAGRWEYASVLVESIEGGLKRLDGTVTIREQGGRTAVSATTEAEIEGVPSRDVRYDLGTRARRIKKLMQDELE